jgi:hypothetical protein
VSEPDAAAALHQLTQHWSPTDRSLLVDFPPLDPGNRPSPFKRCRRLTTPTTTDFGDSGAWTADVLSGRGRAMSRAMSAHRTSRPNDGRDDS